MTTTQTPKTGLPTIVQFLGCDDSGEYGNALCPHCGAKGRYVFHFLCDDGNRHGAMAGCIKLFPVSKIADEHKKIIERARERALKGYKLASWDVAKLTAIEAFYSTDMGATEFARVWDVIRNENNRRSNYMAKKGYGR